MLFLGNFRIIIIILHILLQLLGFEIGELDSVLEFLELLADRLVFQAEGIFIIDNFNKLFCGFRFVT